jgi:proton-dependent oligopeptide transporter, POT family
MSADFFGHPRGLAPLFFTEFWERFSYYGMRALLILFMTAPLAGGGLGFDTARAAAIYGAYTGLVYLMSVPGGWIADRLLGQRYATLCGGVVILLGHVSLAVPSLTTFYLGLLLVIVGTGLLKPNVSAMVGQLYAADDPRRDAGFSIYYMGINLGAFLAPFMTGWLAQSTHFRGILAAAGLSPANAWHWGFAIAAVGMFCGLVQYVRGWKVLGEVGLPVVKPGRAGVRAHRGRRFRIAVVLGLAALALALYVGKSGAPHITPERFSAVFGVLLLVMAVGLFGAVFLFGRLAPDERQRLWVLLVLFVASSTFWAVYEQAGSTLNLFAQRNTDTTVLGYTFPPSWLQGLPGLFVILLAPVFAWLWIRLGTREPSTATKFTFGLLFVSLGFAVLIFPASSLAKASPLWLALTYLLHVIGELCVSPVGLSATTKLAPARFTGLMMGAWFLSTSIGTYVGGLAAGLYDTFALPSLFGVVAAAALGAAAILALLIRPVQRLTSPAGRDDQRLIVS